MGCTMDRRAQVELEMGTSVSPCQLVGDGVPASWMRRSTSCSCPCVSPTTFTLTSAPPAPGASCGAQGGNAYEQTVMPHRWRIPVHYEQTVRPHWCRIRSGDPGPGTRERGGGLEAEAQAWREERGGRGEGGEEGWERGGKRGGRAGESGQREGGGTSSGVRKWGAKRRRR